MYLPDNIILTKSRQVNHCPPHFVKVTIVNNGDDYFVPHGLDDHPTAEQKVRNWLHENIEHRFFIGRDTSPEKAVFLQNTIVAFEDPLDATFFSLMLPKLVSK